MDSRDVASTLRRKLRGSQEKGWVGRWRPGSRYAWAGVGAGTPGRAGGPAPTWEKMLAAQAAAVVSEVKKVACPASDGVDHPQLRVFQVGGLAVGVDEHKDAVHAYRRGPGQRGYSAPRSDPT